MILVICTLFLALFSSKVRNLFTGPEKLANYIKNKKICLNDLLSRNISKNQVYQLAKYLEYVKIENNLYSEDKKLDLSRIINSCSNQITHLIISNSSQEEIINLPELPNCRYFKCSYSTLINLPKELPLCEGFNVTHYPSVKPLPKLPNCKLFVFTRGGDLENLAEPALERLNLSELRLPEKCKIILKNVL